MKLSEAILKGCEMTPRQSFGEFGKWGVSTCAIGAAREAGLDVYKLYSGMDPLPDLPGGNSFLDQIINLNDELRWSREKIAAALAERGL